MSATGSIEAVVEESSGIILTTGRGHWSLAEVDAYYARVGRFVGNLRAERRPVRILIDLADAEIQRPEIQTRINDHAGRLYAGGDRVAVIVRNSLVKAHGRKISPTDVVAFFCSPSAARMWLLAATA